MRPKPVQTNPEEEGTTDFLLEHKRALVTVSSTSAKKGLQHEALPLTKVGIFQNINENIIFYNYVQHSCVSWTAYVVLTFLEYK